jgi:serine/threonine protein kinase/Tfp pilus assembly protein PilF
VKPREPQAKSAPAAPAAEGLAFTQVPDHELLRKIGGGSYGEVWLARNALGTYRAIKIVYRKSFAHERPFEREFSGIKKFEPISRSHDGLMDILQVGRNDEAGYFYSVMELADDANAERRVQNAEWGTQSQPNGEVTECGSDAQQAQDLDTPPLHHTSSSPLHPSTHGSAPPSASYVPRTVAYDLTHRGRLPIEDCLTLGLAMTSALGHLHKHGLVHRDVKPSNIIFVGGEPKLADIGLVADAADAPSYVGTEGFIPPEGPGTPQADLYSLGKVLYEISTGKDRHDYPELPTKLDESANSVELIELNEIVLRACRADPRKRYHSAEQMHADLLLLQRGRSIKQVRKLERRLALATRVGIAAGAAALVAVGGYIGSIKQIQRARRAEMQARESAKKAQTESAKNLQVLHFFEEMLQGAGPEVAKGRDATLLKEILDKTTERIAAELTNAPEVEAEVRYFAARVYLDLAEVAAAERMQRRVVELQRQLHPNGHADLADALSVLGYILLDRAELPEAQALCREAVTMGKQCLGPKDRNVAAWLSNLAMTLRHEGKSEEAETLYREALSINLESFGNVHREVAACLNNLAIVLAQQGKLSEAEEQLKRALAIDRKLFSSEHPLVARNLTSLTLILSREGKLREAEDFGREALTLQSKLLPQNHPDVAATLGNLAGVLESKGSLQEAEAMQREALAIRRVALDAHDPVLGLSLYKLGELLDRRGSLPEAEAALRESLTIARVVPKNATVNPTDVLALLNKVLDAEGKPSEAQEPGASQTANDVVQGPASSSDKSREGGSGPAEPAPGKPR